MIKFTASLQLDRGALLRAKERLRGAPNRVHAHRLSVGIHEQEASAQPVQPGKRKANTNRLKMGYRRISDAHLIDVALFHEFGGAHLPQRSWLRSWFDQNLEEIKADAVFAMRAEYSGDLDAVPRLAAQWREELQAWIRDDAANLQHLSRRTEAERVNAGLSEGPPLYATGQLVRAIAGLVDGRYAP